MSPKDLLMQELSPQQKKLEHQKIANLCYLLEYCMEESERKSRDIRIEERTLLKEWSELVNLYVPIDLLADHFLGIKKLPKEQEEILNYIRSKNKTIEDVAAVPLSPEQLGRLLKKSNIDHLINKEEGDFVFKLARMSENHNAHRNARYIFDQLIKSYNQNKHILVCLAQTDLQRTEILEFLKEYGMDIDELIVFEKNRTVIDGKLTVEIDYRYEHEKGYIPNSVLLDPKAITEHGHGLPNGDYKKFANENIKKLLSVLKSFRGKMKIPILLYGNGINPEVTKQFPFCSVLPRGDYNQYPNLNELISNINKIYGENLEVKVESGAQNGR